MSQVYPTNPIHPVPSGADYDGVDVRTWMATRIMAGFASDPSVSEAHDSGLTDEALADLANSAVRWADALIAALNRN